MQAQLQFIEKRQIELSGAEEIEPIVPIPLGSSAGGVAGDDDASETGENEGRDDGTGDWSEAVIEKLVWVGKFIYQFMFWELAIDAQGTLVRIKKAR